MTSISELESGAQHLRACLAVTHGAHTLLCGLQFFGWLAERTADGSHATFVEACLREFIPAIAVAAADTANDELLPDEARKLRELVTLTRTNADVVSQSDCAALESLSADCESAQALRAPATDDDQVMLAGLLVEYRPDLRLPPRGRLLWIRVEASERRHGKTEDQAVISGNRDNEFEQQAGLAVRLAREFLVKQYQLPAGKRYRVDFEILNSSAPMTGPSLGLALAVGAAVAISKCEIFRESLQVPHDVAFSGALTSDGRLAGIDRDGLRLKLQRAVHAGLRHVIVPVGQIAQAWEDLREFTSEKPDANLNLVAAADVATVLADRNLVFPQKRTISNYRALRIRRRLQQPQVGIPVLFATLAILALVAWPSIRSWVDRNPVSLRESKRGFTVYNQYGRALWSKEFICDSISPPMPPPHVDRNWKIIDLDGDARNEIIYYPIFASQSPEANWLYCYSHDGSMRFRRYCPVLGEFPGDTAGVLYDFELLSVPIVAGRPIIITEVAISPPSRSHIRLWGANGDSLGWYINAGGSRFWLAEDLNGDGREELLFLCYYHRLNGTSLLVLDPDSAYGCSPPYDRFKPDGRPIERGRQYAYIFLPTTELGRVDVRVGYSQPHELRRLGNGEIAVYNGESNQDPSACVTYVFSRDLKLNRIYFTDQYITRHRQLVDSARVTQSDLSLAAEMLMDSVLSLTPEGWAAARIKR